ncbi:hypothetical protein BU25DRAFT_476649 [Macroventuria anomochaeta]|uniref:Uncharacterized protein n=1 Tax=Macroventuria anomochaeta TaxID=301207 RepID=A0ACB6RRI0_9PLEO|nr:uncharacterized protein BU25DRAFT_476649 [Macroventuria anomochaeta]KAF2624408.1 hypothetical protein BU25DRAFT_476649 [Macroventuria anomochaeta]
MTNSNSARFIMNDRPVFRGISSVRQASPLRDELNPAYFLDPRDGIPEMIYTDATSTGAVHGSSDAGDEFNMRPRSISNLVARLTEASSGGRNYTEVDYTTSGIPDAPDYYQEAEADAASDQSSPMPLPISNLDMGERGYDRAPDTGEISSIDSNRVAFSDDGEGEGDTASFEELIDRISSSFSPPQSSPLEALCDIPVTEGPDQRHLDLGSALHQPDLGLNTHSFKPKHHYPPSTTAANTAEEYKPKTRKATFEQRRDRVLADTRREYPTSVTLDRTQSLEIRLYQVISTLLTPPPGYYNPLDNTYTLDLDWAMDVIGPLEFADSLLMRKVLHPGSVFCQQVAVDAGMPKRIAAWLSGSPSMQVHRFPAEIFRVARSPGVLAASHSGWAIHW